MTIIIAEASMMCSIGVADKHINTETTYTIQVISFLTLDSSISRFEIHDQINLYTGHIKIELDTASTSITVADGAQVTNLDTNNLGSTPTIDTATGEVLISGVDPSVDPSVKNFKFDLSKVTNSPSERIVNNIKCSFCSSSTTCLVEATVAGVQIIRKVTNNAGFDAVQVFSDNTINGATLGDDEKFSIQIQNAESLGQVAHVEATIPYGRQQANYGGLSDEPMVTTDSKAVKDEFKYDLDTLYNYYYINGSYVKTTHFETSGDSLTLQITKIKNPPTTEPVSTGFSICTMDANNYYIECFYDFSYETTTAGDLNIKSIEPSDYAVGAVDVTYTITLEPANGILPYSTVEYLGSSSWTLSDLSFELTESSTSLSTYANKNGFYDIVSYPQSDQTKYEIPDQEIELKISGFKNPIDTAERTITISTYHKGKYPTDTSTFTLSSFTLGTIKMTSDSITTNDTEIYSQNTKYTIRLSTATDFDVTQFGFNIFFPSLFTFTPNTKCYAQLAYTDADTKEEGTYEAASCLSMNNDGEQKQMLISQFSTDSSAEAIKAGSTLDLTVDSIQNPGQLEVTGSFGLSPEVEIKVYNPSTGGTVDEVQSSLENGKVVYVQYVLTYTMSNISSFAVEPSSTTTGEDNVVYSFTVVPEHRVSQHSYLELSIPSQIQLSSSSFYIRSSQCSAISGFRNTITCNYYEDNHKIRIIQGFFTEFSEGNPPTLEFSIGVFKNPRSMEVTDPFNITIYDEDDNAMYAMNSTTGPTVQMNGISTPSDIHFVRDSEENGRLTNLQLRVQHSNEVLEGDTVQVTLPKGIRFTNVTKGFEQSSYIGKELNLTLSNFDRTVSFPLDLSSRRRRLRTIPANQYLEFNFTSIMNPSSLRPVEGYIEYQLKEASGGSIEGSSSQLQVVNSEASALEKVTILPDYWEKEALANYTLSFVPFNYEQNMMIQVEVPKNITIPEGLECISLFGTDSQNNLTCIVNGNTILFPSAFLERDVAPENVTIVLRQLRNPPLNDTRTESFKIATLTHDGFLIDNVTTGLEMDFFCKFPCATCDSEEPTKCLSCYQGSPFIFLFGNECLDVCTPGMYGVEATASEVATCKFCEFPCSACTSTSDTCTSCEAGWTLYSIESSCYEIINYPFPLLMAASFFFLVVLLVDCIKKSTNFLHSLIFFYAFLEVICWAVLIYLYFSGEVKGDRSLSIVSFGSQVLLNIVFAPVHYKLMLPKSPPEYQHLFEKYNRGSWTIQWMAYTMNFKMTLFLLSDFAARPRFRGVFSQDNWGKFNLFGIAYLLLVYIAFLVDFYLYFTSNGLRTLASYVAIETTIIMTVISLILVLEVISSCWLTGIREQDLGKRANLGLSSKKLKKGRRSLRSGMANEEEEYDSELYGSEYDDEVDKISLEGTAEQILKRRLSSLEDIDEEEEEGEYEQEDLENEFESPTRRGRRDRRLGDSQDSYDEEDPEESQEEISPSGDLRRRRRRRPSRANHGLDQLEELAEEFKEAMLAQKREKQLTSDFGPDQGFRGDGEPSS